MGNIPKVNKNSESDKKIDFSKAKEVIGKLLGLFKVPPLPAPQVNKLTALSAIQRPGFSASKVAGEIIKRQSEAGALIGANDDGTENIAEKMEKIRVEEIQKAIVRDVRVTIAGIPGQTVTTTGTAGPIPVTTVGTVITTGTGYGVLS